MEKSWKILNLCLGLLYCELCNGLPINLENTVADSHTQLLTGLVAVLLTVCSVVFLAGCLCCQRKNGFKEFKDSPVIASSTSNLDHGHINPVANGEFTIFTPLSPPHQNNNVFLANQQIITRTQEDYIFEDVDVSSWFNGTETDFPRIKLKYIKEIGKGWFGRVVEGAAQDIDSEQKWTPVVVRILEATASSRERVVFLHDAAIYRCGIHQNILKLFGRCLDTIPLLLLQEYCPQGDLKDYLRQNKPTADKLLSTEYPLVWCCQLSSALKHLHDNRLTHPDLAARNCQLTSNLILKLGDYGLAVFQYPEDYYQGAPGVPVRWCAPESLSYTSTTIQPKQVTLEANIWSLAVTMWEICECGEQPYSSLSDDEVLSQVLGSQNVRLTRPKYQVLYTDYIFRLMQLCWTSSESRPAVAQINLMLGDLLQVYKNTTSTQTDSSVSMKDFDKRWESFKPNSIVKTDNHIADSTEIDLDDSEIVSSKPLSPSLNNLHGSLDNLLVDSSESQMESWLENVATKTGDMSYVRGLSDAIKDLDNAIALENSTSSDSSHQQSPTPEHIKNNSKIEFKLGPLISKSKAPDSPNQNDSLTDSLLFIQRTSSESETEEENWKKKIERGAYSEKVRQKSRSVADLMILTHIDHSESESETPLPSLDYRTNYKNVRYVPKQNLENASLMFGSEGNLLNVQETFQEELKKLQEERRDSLLFVPENRSQSNSSENLLNDSAGDEPLDANVSRNIVSSSVSNKSYLEDSPSKRILQELNSTSEIKPANQVFNVFNVTIDKFNPVQLNSSKLNEFIHFKDDECIIRQTCNDVYEVPKLSDIIRSNSEVINYVSNTNTFDYVDKSLSDDECENSEVMYDSGVEGDRMESTESLKNATEERPQDLKENPIENELEIKNDITKIENISDSSTVQNLHITTLNEPHEETMVIKSNETFEVPKLVDLIQNNDELMDYIIARYETESIGKSNDSLDSLETCTYKETEHFEKNSITKTKEFLADEVKNYEIREPAVMFDLSENQDQAMPNSLTHSSVFTSTPFSKRSLQELTSTLPHQNGYSSLNLFKDSGREQKGLENNSALYSLETWDNFLGKALDQNESQENELFDSFSSEPQSLLFIENDILADDVKSEDSESQETHQDRTYVCDEKKNSTFAIDPNTVDINDTNLEVDFSSKREDNGDRGSWENNGGGWFLHPQTNNDLSGELTVSSNADTDSYVGFNVDDEIMAAIRNELLNKLPQAQGGSNGIVHDEEEWDSVERNEVFLRYNVYNTPLSPIPEESLIEDNSCEHTPRHHHSEDEDEESDWSDNCERETLQHDTESHSAHTVESPIHPEPLHRHTPSQDSCCSNDTLFNLEELTYAVNDAERDNNSPTNSKITDGESQFIEENLMKQIPAEVMSHAVNSESRNDNYEIDVDNRDTLEVTCENRDTTFECSEALVNVNGYRTEDCSETIKENVDRTEVIDKRVIIDFLTSERQHDCVKGSEALDESNSESIDHLLPFINKQVAPLPSPEDNPWKQLPASLLSYDTVISQNMLLPTSETNDVVLESQDLPEKDKIELLYVNVPEKNCETLKGYEEHEYENVNEAENTECYENVTNIDDFYNEADYVNMVNLENTKNSAEYINSKQVTEDKDDHTSPDYVNDFEQQDQLIINNEDERDIFGVLTDIRFSGPSDNQLMTTSFSESNDLNDEQDWDSGSDTRSSSSGEFIWKEGEHEESLKALRAAPQDVLEDMQPMEGIQEETSSESSGSDEEGESPEFVPSAWDKYATPTKSALRSPEKTLEKTEKKKTKGVWFKKQKYHCVYEYPREPDSPVLHSYDLWKPQPDYTSFDDWELDGTDPYLPAENSDDGEISQNYYQPKSSRSLNMYQLSSIADFPSNEPGMDDEFFISSSAKPFDMISGLSSQFFPGNWTELNKPTENATPDSGVEDITPGSLIENDFMPQLRNVQSLKQLATDAVKKNKKVEDLRTNDVLGGLRHTRNKLKLDLPPSPSAFTSNKMFSIEPVIDPVMNREKPTFTTFGKTRFLVQHVDTPPDDEANKYKNVSFEALPYKPIQKHILKEDFDVIKNKGKVEIVRGEASLLDSADEDSGIESSTLERKLSSTV